MALAGYLSEYSLAEIFNFVHEGSRTGLLSISPNPRTLISTSNSYNYLWFESGRIVAATTGLDGKGLLMNIGQRKLMSPAQIELAGILIDELPQPLGIYLKSRGTMDIDVVGTALYNIPQPLGLYLKSYGLLDAEQLKLLFNSQTIAVVSSLFQLKDNQFKFDPDREPINAEMTGISLPAQEMGLLGLRFLKDWSGLKHKLADADCSIRQSSSQAPMIRLDRNESNVLRLADGKTSLDQIALKLDLSLEVVRQISFRLSTFDIVKEIPIEAISEVMPSYEAVPISAPGFKNASVSNSFLGNLKKFLRKGNEKSPKSLTR